MITLPSGEESAEGFTTACLDLNLSLQDFEFLDVRQDSEMATQQQVTEIATLEPSAVWSLFAQVAEIPRPSRKEERIRNRVREIAEAHGLSTRSDKVGNLVIDVPASPGCESAPLTVLQAHFDMVCEKNASCTHNFDEDPISLIVDTSVLRMMLPTLRDFPAFASVWAGDVGRRVGRMPDV